MFGGCAIYVGDQHLASRTNPFGKDVANRGLYRALVEHGPWDDQLFLVHRRVNAEELGRSLFDGRAPRKTILSTTILDHAEIAARGVLLRGQANIAEHGWIRRTYNERAYSLVGLIHNPERARAIGAAARRHARNRFDWSAVIPQYARLFEDLAEIRGSVPAYEQGWVPADNPVRRDPFAAFADFATEVVSEDTLLRPGKGGLLDPHPHHAAGLNAPTAAWRLPVGQSVRIRDMVAERGVMSVAEVMRDLGEVPRDALLRHLVWMCKVGLLDWEAAEVVPLDRPDPT